MAESIVSELRKFVAPEFIFGNDSRKLVGRYVDNFGGKNVLLVTDSGVKKAGWAHDVETQLQETGTIVTVFDAVSPNPRSREVMAGAEVYRTSNSDVIVAVGGGSVIDCAKGIGIVASNNDSVLRFEGVDQVPLPMPPLICIPTTGGTSADVSQFAIITNEDERVKIAIISKAVVPDVALIDPVTLTTMDPYLTACTGIDAMVHAIEAFVSNAHSPITDLHALEAIRLLSASLLSSVRQPDDLDARSAVMLASLQAGLAFSNASLGAVHAMAHSLGGFKDLPHGECNALLLPHVMNFNFDASPERYTRIGDAMGIDLRGMSSVSARNGIMNHVMTLRNECGIPAGLAARGVVSADINRLAEKALLDPCNATNPKRPGKRDLEVIYEEAM